MKRLSGDALDEIQKRAESSFHVGSMHMRTVFLTIDERDALVEECLGHRSRLVDAFRVHEDSRTCWEEQQERNAKYHAHMESLQRAHEAREAAKK